MGLIKKSLVVLAAISVPFLISCKSVNLGSPVSGGQEPNRNPVASGPNYQDADYDRVQSTVFYKEYAGKPIILHCAYFGHPHAAPRDQVSFGVNQAGLDTSTNRGLKKVMIVVAPHSYAETLYTLPVGTNLTLKGRIFLDYDVNPDKRGRGEQVFVADVVDKSE